MKKIFSLLIVAIPFAVLGYASDSQTNANIRDIANLHLVKLDKSAVVNKIGTPSSSTVPSTLALIGTMVTFDNNTSGVKKFNGRKGFVTPLTGDYTAAQVGADPSGSAAAVKDTTTNTGILKGNGSVISAAVNSDLPAMSATVGGAVPTPPNDATKFLNGAAGFTVPAGTYSLPTATSLLLGGVKPDGTSILNSAGSISVTPASIGALAVGAQAADSAKLSGVTVDSAAPASGDLLRYDGAVWRHVALASGDIPANTANTTGTASNVTGTVALGNGGTGQTTAQAAINALTGTTSGYYLRANGTNAVMTTIQAVDVPTLNQNTTGSAAKLTTARTINTVSFDGSANIQTATANTSDYTKGIVGSAFNVTATGLVVVGGTGVTYTRNYVKIGDVITFRLEVNANGGTTASTAGTTYFSTNLSGAGNYAPCGAVNVSTVASYGEGMTVGSTIYAPTWAATAGTVVIGCSYLAY